MNFILLPRNYYPDPYMEGEVLRTIVKYLCILYVHNNMRDPVGVRGN